MKKLVSPKVNIGIEEFFAENNIKKGTIKHKIIVAFLIKGKLTDYHLDKMLKINPNSVRPGRINLVKKGILQATTTKEKIRNRQPYTVWGIKDFFLKKLHKQINGTSK